MVLERTLGQTQGSSYWIKLNYWHLLVAIVILQRLNESSGELYHQRDLILKMRLP